MELSLRARRILYATLTEYIASGEPVSSRVLSRRYELSLSPATIRDALADLEEGGFLFQPHTSAGRVPTDKGFRVFIDALLQIRELAEEDRELIAAKLHALEPGADVAREAGRLLSQLTGAAAVVRAPKVEEERLAHVRFMPLRPGEMLAVLITRGGTVQNRAIRVGWEVDLGELERVHNYLQALLQEGLSLAGLRDALSKQMEQDRGQYDRLTRAACEVVDATLERNEPSAEVVVEGQDRLLDRPEFAQVGKLRSLVRTLEDKEKLLELLDRTLATAGVQVLIGSETQLGDVPDLSVVAATFGRGPASGSVGVLGPTRMDYSKVVPLVGYTARIVGDVLSEQISPPSAPPSKR